MIVEITIILMIPLDPGEGVLLPPFTPHAYFPDTNTATKTWHTRFVTLNGLLEDQFTKILGTNQVIFAKDNQEFSYSQCIDRIVTQLETRAWTRPRPRETATAC